MAMVKKDERQNNNSSIVCLSVCQRFVKEIVRVSVKEVGLHQIYQHNRLECHSSIMLAYWVDTFQIMELKPMTIDQYTLIEQSVETTSCNRALKCIVHSSLDQYSLVEVTFSEIL